MNGKTYELTEVLPAEANQYEVFMQRSSSAPINIAGLVVAIVGIDIAVLMGIVLLLSIFAL